MKKKTKPVKSLDIDFDNIQNRIVNLKLPARSYPLLKLQKNINFT